ncbi:PREDICTED: anthocyanidin 3-O-glucosyltransferase 5-like [Nicotiana attenuata]|uniref:Glycosyltransferase n=1 Tax=Nicotiana attenuata TaxID=49451 RepID=A0A2H4GSF7_NICAT|nr:PREDICTED: anthocyanidin 3-O-glucosyltransferase 5-like [Nicotiana attenuata]AQQ16654.1 UDP-glycosyltransferase g15196 [Nicotiana attenuata]
MGSSEKLHVGILSSPGLGHIIPVLVLGSHLATHHNVSVTIFVITSGSSLAEKELLKSANKSKLIDIVEIPAVDISNLIDANTKMVTQLCVLVRESLPVVKSVIFAKKHILDALIVDLFCTEALPIAKEFWLPNYVYVPCNAWFTALTVYCQVLDKEIEGQYVDQDEPLKIPGCKPVRPEDVVDPMLDRNDQQYSEYMRVLGLGFCLSDGILMNTWEDAEPGSLKALRENETLKSIVKSTVYPIGPLCRRDEQIIDGSDNRNFVLKWLDEQTQESVLYVSFGSGGTLSSKQLTELAFGLELSQQKFVWIVRPPSEVGADKSFFTTGKEGDDTPQYLPEGFLTRTQDFGLVVQMWADQVRILSHPSVGGFLSHCGWNSNIESITNGVPMIAWPLYAEQRQNATILTEGLGVAVRPKVLPTKKVVEREEIKKLVRTVMQYREGKELRENVKKLKMSAEKALSVGGSSHNSMCEAIKDIEKRIHCYKKSTSEETVQKANGKGHI